MIVKVLFLQQPYATYVATGRKTIETRIWGTSYRGPILICSSQSGEGPDGGLALCLVDVYHVRMMIDADAEAACIARYPKARAWLLRNRRPLDQPFAIKGALGLRDREIDDALLACHPADPSHHDAPHEEPLWLFDSGA